MYVHRGWRGAAAPSNPAPRYGACRAGFDPASTQNRRRVARSASGVAPGDPRRPAAHGHPPPSTAARSSADAPALRVTAASARAGRLLRASRRLTTFRTDYDAPLRLSRRPAPRLACPAVDLPTRRSTRVANNAELPVSGRVASKARAGSEPLHPAPRLNRAASRFSVRTPRS